jgi:beta-1,2-mannobiose phosphorylase / 1,2-beta-oligomannan phosphorylase
MSELVYRHPDNPILRPSDCQPSRSDLCVECLLNPGAFQYNTRIGLLVRVAERPLQEDGWIATPTLDPQVEGGIRIARFRRDDHRLKQVDPRVFSYEGRTYLTTLSHLRLAWSEDRHRFTIDDAPTLTGAGMLEEYGIEDARVTRIDDQYFITYTAASRHGHGVGMISTDDWRRFTRHGMIFTVPNKDCALFPRKINGRFYALHRPTAGDFGGNQMWLADSPDLVHWGNHRPLMQTRPDAWDSVRVGAGAAPIETSQGWLQIYHGADSTDRYGLGAILLDLNDPSRLLQRTIDPIMSPIEDYETSGFFGQVVFTNGHIVCGDRVTIYYGAADSVICVAELSIERTLATLRRC